MAGAIWLFRLWRLFRGLVQTTQNRRDQGREASKIHEIPKCLVPLQEVESSEEVIPVVQRVLAAKERQGL